MIPDGDQGKIYGMPLTIPGLFTYGGQCTAVKRPGVTGALSREISGEESGPYAITAGTLDLEINGGFWPIIMRISVEELANRFFH